MTTTRTDGPAASPALSAEEIGGRFLKLFEGLESQDELDLERVRRITGIALSDAPESERLAHGEALGGGWYYSFWHVPKSRSFKNGVSLSFVNPTEPSSDMTALCELDFDAYRRALADMGFREVPIPGEIGQIDAWRYYRGDITLSVRPRNALPGQAGRVCIETIGTLN